MLSVIIPVYNVQKYVLRCLESCDKQKLKEIEFIIVNDGSTDNSAKICENFIRDKPCFRMISKPNGGLMSAWMEGLNYAQGGYVGFVDSDDYINEDMFSILYAKALDYRADVVMCNHKYIRHNGTVDNVPCIREGYYSGGKLHEIYCNIFPRVAIPYISPSRCSKIFRKKILLDNIKFCDTRISSGEDVNIVIPVMLSMKNFYFLNSPLYYYVRRSDSITGNYNEKLLDTYLILLSKIKESLIFYGKTNYSIFYEGAVTAYAYSLTEIILSSSHNVKKKHKNIRKVFNTKLFQESALFSLKSDSLHVKIFKFSMQNHCFYIYCLKYYLLRGVKMLFRR